MGKTKKTIVLIIILFSCLVQQARANDVESMFEQGFEAFRTQNYGSAELMFRKIIDNGNTGDFRDKAWYYLALSIFNQKRYKAAIFEFNRYLLTCTSQDLCNQSIYWRAESYFHLKDYIKAIEEFRRFISRSKNDLLISAARDRIGEIYFIQDRYDEAIIEWKEAINTSSNVQQNNRRVLKIGEALYLDEKLDDALKLLKSLLDSNAEREAKARARLIIGRIYLIKGKHREALRIFYGIPESLIKKAPFQNAQYFKAISSIKLNDIYSAKAYLQSFLLLGENSEWYYDAKYELGKIYLRGTEDNEGIKLLEEVRNSTKKMDLRSKAALILGKIYLKNNPSEAVPYLEDAVSLTDPEEQLDALLLLSRVYIETGRHEDAERILDLLINTYPEDKNNDYVLFYIARIALENNNIEKAVKNFNRIREIAPNSSYVNESYYYLALCYSQMNKDGLAVELFNKYIKIKGTEKKYEAYQKLAGLYLHAGKYTTAEKMIKYVMNFYWRKSGVEKVIYEFGKEIKAKGRDNTSFYGFVINRYPKSESAGKILLEMGDELFKTRKYDQAERYYTLYLLIESRPNAGSVYLYKMICLYELKRFRAVINNYRDNSSLVVNDYTKKQISIITAKSYYNLHNYEKAYKIFMSWPLTDYSDDELVTICRCSIKLGDLSTALAVPEFLKNNKTAEAEVYYLIGKYNIKKDKIDVAEDFFNKSMQANKDSEYAERSKIEIAKLFIKNRKFENALALINSLSDSRNNLIKNSLIIKVYFGTGKSKEAILLTRKYINRFFKDPAGEEVLKDNLRYYYQSGDLRNFTIYAGYLGRFAGNTGFINNLTAKIYFEKGNFNTAYFYFYKVAQRNSEYKTESLYFLGLISMFKQRNIKRAVYYFEKAVESGEDSNPYVIKSQINLSLLLKENGQPEKSYAVLEKLIKKETSKTGKIQAANLLKYYKDFKKEQFKKD